MNEELYRKESIHYLLEADKAGIPASFPGIRRGLWALAALAEGAGILVLLLLVL